MRHLVLLTSMLVLGGARFASADLITLVSDSRYVSSSFYGTVTPPSAFAPFDVQLPWSPSFPSSFGDIAGQTSTVTTTGMAGSLFANAEVTGFECDEDFIVCWTVHGEMGESRLQVEFDANVSAPLLLDGFIAGDGWNLSIRDLTANAWLLASPSAGGSSSAGQLQAGHRYRLVADTVSWTIFALGSPNQIDFSLQLFDPASAALFGGATTQASLLGGAGATGGLDITLGSSSGPGVLSSTFDTPTLAEIEALYSAVSFELPNGESSSLWDISTGGTLFNGLAEIVFAYDPSLLPPGFDETRLAIFHLEGGSWVELLGTVDPTANTIAAFTSSFSPFVVGVTLVPEPGTALLLGAGLMGLARNGRRANRTAANRTRAGI